MRVLCVVTLMMVALAVAQENVKQPFTITITTDTPVIKAGAPLLIKSQLTNTSGQDLNVSGGIDRDTGLKSNHIFDVRDKAGNSVTKKSHKQVGPLTGSVVFGTLKQGESSVHVEDVSRAYDLSRPGQYVIQISRPIPSDPQQVVKSNKITVTVTP